MCVRKDISSKLAVYKFPLWIYGPEWDAQTDRQTDRQTDIGTDATIP